MKKGDFIRVILSSGIKEEGIIEEHRFRDEDGEVWVILIHKNNPNAKVNINKKYIAAYQIENLETNNKIEELVELKTLVVDDLSLTKPEINHKIRVEKLAELGIDRGKKQRQALLKLIQKPVNQNPEAIYDKYNLPSFLK